MKKRIISLALVIGILLGVVLMTSETVSATSVSQSDAVAWAKSKIGIGLDYDGAYGVQCVDLIYYYYRYLGVSSVGGNACDYSSNTLPSGWIRITSNITPKPGDIAVWKSNYSDGYWTTGWAGHIGIVVSGNASTYSMIHQNVSGVKTCMQTNNITTATLACVIRPNFSAASSTPTLTWSTDTSRQTIGKTNAVLANRCDLSGVNTESVSKVGIVLRDCWKKVVAQKEELASLGSYSYFLAWYDVNSSLNYTLQPGTNYEYQFWAEIGGKKYYSQEYSFTTSGMHVCQYGAGTVISDATCLSPGTIVYVCKTCGNPKEETIPKLTTHTYDSSCDTTCNICTFTREVQHNYNSSNKCICGDERLGILTQPKTAKVKAGSTAKFTVKASGNGLKYQWQSSTNGKTWKNCSSSSAKKATFTFTSKTSHSSNYYRCRVTDAAGDTVYTDAVRLYVLGVTTQPKTQKVEAGEKVKFTVSATGASKTYQWQVSTDGKTWKNCTSSSAKKAAFTFTGKTSHSSNYYRCRIKDNAGNTVYTDAVRLYVLGITEQPVSKTVTKGKTAKFTVEATGASKVYQWQVSTDGGKTWKNCSSSSAKKATFTFTSKTTHNGNYYRCRVKDNGGNTVYTAKVKLTVKK